MFRSDAEFLDDIKEAIRRIQTYIAGVNYNQFIDDTKIQDAVVRNLEIIGEAAKNISGKIKKQYPEISWKHMAALRDRLIHHYFGINYDIVWEIITVELPKEYSLMAQINQGE